MTIQEIAGAIGEVPVEEIAELTDLIFDEIEARHSVEEVQEIVSILTEAGVDVVGICRKKHPT